MPLLSRASMIILAAVIAGGVHSMYKPVRVRPVDPGPMITLPSPAPVTADGTRAPTGDAPAVAATPAAMGLEITVAQALDLYNDGAQFLDARSLREYEAGHVEGAFHLAADTFNTATGQRVVGMLDRSQILVVYCGGGACDASHNLVILLQQAGYMRCHVMTDGYPAWLQAGLPVGEGAGMMGGGQ
ncbi:MAG: rhodanese-like domain-containing protein [Phycisphaeraceae bacterium]|nr:rhodanese-like domain-containing protein [Phycisphaeraceae bacterium]